MTAPFAPRLSVVAGLDVVRDTIWYEHEMWHEAYRDHVDLHCPFVCGRGGICREGQRLLDEADNAGKRLARADALARRAAVRP